MPPGAELHSEELWDKIRQAYIYRKELPTFEELHMEFGPKPMTIREREKKEMWRDQRKEFLARKKEYANVYSVNSPPGGLWEDMERTFIHEIPKPTYKELSERFGVTVKTIQKKATKYKWLELRNKNGTDVRPHKEIKKAEIKQAIKEARKEKYTDQEMLDATIVKLWEAMQGTKSKTLEGVASSINSLIRTKRELFPYDVNDIARMAIDLGITPADFVRALKEQYAKDVAAPEDNVVEMKSKNAKKADKSG